MLSVKNKNNRPLGFKLILTLAVFCLFSLLSFVNAVSAATDKPPAIKDVCSYVGADKDNEYPIGSYVKFSVTEKYNARDIVSGVIRVTSLSQNYDSGLINITKIGRGSYYFCHWDTHGLGVANDYIVAATLTDAKGQTNADGSKQDPRLTISLILGPPPAHYGTHLETDFSIPSIGIPLKFERYYLNDMKHDGSMGYNWTHNYNMHIAEVEDGNVQLWDERDIWNFFIKNPDGSYNSPLGSRMTLIKNPDGTFTLKRPNNLSYNFNKSGNLSSIRDLSGNQLILSYSNRFLTTITDTSGRVITFTSYSNGKIKTITDFTGRTFNYEYDSIGNLIKYTNPAGHETTYEYNTAEYSSRHNLIIITNPRGYHTYLSYYPDGRLKSKYNDNNNNKVSYEYCDDEGKIIKTSPRGYITTEFYKNNKVVKSIDAYGNSSHKTWDNKLNLTSATDVNGHTWNYTSYKDGNTHTKTSPPDKDNIRHTWTYTYCSDFNKIKTLTDPEENITTHKYNSNGNLLKTKKMLGEEEIITSYTYYPNGLLKTKTEPKGNVENPDGNYTATYEYDLYGNLTKVVDSLGNKTINTYDALGNLKNKTTPEGNATTFNYDTLNRLTRIRDLQGNTIKYKYDGMDNLITLTITDNLNILHSKNTTTAYKYDEVDRLKKITDAKRNTTEYKYDLSGNLITTTIIDKTKPKKPVIYITTYKYDKLGRLINIYQWLSKKDCYITTYKYDKAGNRIKIIDGRGNTTTYKYDSLDRLWKIINAQGNTTSYTYDKVDNPLSKTDANNNTTTYEYDALYRLKKTTDALGNSTQYQYDENSNLKKLIDANSHQTQYTYDEINRLLITTYEDGTTKANEYKYDISNKAFRIRRTDQKKQAINYEYDYLRRLIKKTYPDASTVGYTYDGRGRLTDIRNLTGTIHYTYDILGRVVQVTYPDGNTIGYKYNGLGSRTKLVYPDSDFITYNYDKLNRVKRIKDKASHIIVDYTYDPQVNLRKEKGLLNNTSTTYTYNELYQLTNISNSSPSSQLISGFTYGYDEVGNRGYVIREHEQGRGDVYTYDKTYQLTNVKYNVEDPVTESLNPGSSPFEFKNIYELDPAGNRLSVANGVTIGSTSNNMNQYETVGDVTYRYDANGNTTQKVTPEGIIYYSYDYENRLIKVITPARTINYKYDAYGRRIEKNIAGIITGYLYDGADVILEIDANGNTIAKYVHGARIDEILSATRYTPSAITHYYHYNALGSVTEITDSSGELVEKYSYDAYGEVSITDGQGKPLSESGLSNPYFFTGRRLDTETGLYYYRARYYDPDLGRFLTTDPIGYLGGINLYAYCSNDPVNYTDPWGYYKEPAPEDPGEMTEEEIEKELEELEEQEESEEGLTPEEAERKRQLEKEQEKRWWDEWWEDFWLNVLAGGADLSGATTGSAMDAVGMLEGIGDQVENGDPMGPRSPDVGINW